jgi:AraC-like DNA-binding protein
VPAPARPPAAPLAGAAAFFAAVGAPTQWFQLFEHLPRVYLFVKDLAGRFVKVNTPCALLHGCRHEREMLGRTDFDFHPPALAAQYVEEDRRVIRAGRPLADQVWLVLGHDRMPRWYLSTKMPVLGQAGEAVGLAGVLRPYDHTGASPAAYNRLTPVMEHVVARYGERIALPDLAARAHLSASQLQREFRRLFGQTPGEYLLRVRLLMARRRLEETDDPFGLIALECGFYDQSHFNRAFRAHVGMPPGAYRRRFRRG